MMRYRGKELSPARWIWRGAVLALTLAALALLALLAWPYLGGLVDPAPGFAARKGDLLEVVETRREVLADSTLSELTLRSSSGLSVELTLRLAHELRPGKPVLLILGGQETGRAAAELIPDTHGVVIAALSYPFATIPHRDLLSLLAVLRDIQRGIADMVPSVSLAIDYLQRGPGASDGLELAGISFGAYIAAVPAALDPRVDRLWLVHGSADPVAVIEGALQGRVQSRLLRQGLAHFLGTVAGARHLSPEFWVARVAPRPVVVISARDDSDLPIEAVLALHGALESPSRVIWSNGDHVHPDRPEVVREIAELMLNEMTGP